MELLVLGIYWQVYMFRNLFLTIILLFSFNPLAHAITKTPAKDITVDTTVFSKNLSSADSDVQHALATIDQFNFSVSTGPWTVYGQPGNVGIGTTNSTVGIGTFMGSAGLTVMNGNVGIGTWNPQALVEIGNAANSFRFNTGTLTTTTGSITINSSITMGQNGFTCASGNTSGSCYNASGASWTSGQLFVGAPSSPNFTGDVFRGSYNQGGSGQIANLGIGTLGTGNVLRIINQGTGPSVYMEDQLNDPSPNVFANDGNVGLGTTTTLNNKLEVVGTAQMTGFKLTTNPVASYVLTSDSLGVGTWMPVAAGSSSPWTTTAVTSVYLPTPGNVGIGTLDVSNGSLTIKATTGMDNPVDGTEFLAASTWTSTGWSGGWVAGWDHTPGFTNALVFTGASPVIGTVYHVHIASTNSGCIQPIAFGGVTDGGYGNCGSGSATFDKYYIATTTGQLSITPQNLFGNAGHYIISIKPVTGSIPMVIGKATTNTTGFELRVGQTRNTSLGYQAGQFLAATNGDNYLGSQDNTAFGYQAMANSVNSYQSIAFGSKALSVGQAVGGDTAIGYQALQNTTTGINDVAIGANAMAQNVSGSSNIALAANAMGSMTGGIQNTAIGEYALGFATGSLNYNTAVGEASLEQTVTDNNTCVGAFCLLALNDPSSNEATGIGRYACGDTGNPNFNIIHFAHQATCLGAETAPSADGNTNEIMIGYATHGNGSNTATLGNNNVVKTILKGNVGIGTTLAINKLDVAGGISIGTAYAGYITAPVNGAAIQGNVGIGTSAPPNPLYVVGTPMFTGGLNIGIGTASPTRLCIANNAVTTCP